jgi:hypothetical protein
MSGRHLPLSVSVVLLALVMLVGCMNANKGLFYGTFTNEKAAVKQKMVRSPGVLKYYMLVSDNEPFQQGTEQIISNSVDSDGNNWYKTFGTMTSGPYKGIKFQSLQKLNKAGTILELVYTPVVALDAKSFPKNLSPTDGVYEFYNRAEK